MSAAQSPDRTHYVGPVIVRDGYAGQVAVLHLCAEPGGRVWGVHRYGALVYSDPTRGLRPLPHITETAA